MSQLCVVKHVGCLESAPFSYTCHNCPCRRKDEGIWRCDPRCKNKGFVNLCVDQLRRIDSEMEPTRHPVLRDAKVLPEVRHRLLSVREFVSHSIRNVLRFTHSSPDVHVRAGGLVRQIRDCRLGCSELRLEHILNFLVRAQGSSQVNSLTHSIKLNQITSNQFNHISWNQNKAIQSIALNRSRLIQHHKLKPYQIKSSQSTQLYVALWFSWRIMLFSSQADVCR